MRSKKWKPAKIGISPLTIHNAQQEAKNLQQRFENGETIRAFQKDLRASFGQIHLFTPTATRKRSAEVYLIGRRRKKDRYNEAQSEEE